MKLLEPLTALIIEPNTRLTNPYNSLPFSFNTSRYSSLDQASHSFLTIQPQLVLISASFTPTHIITFLEKVKNESVAIEELIPVIFVVDLNNRLNFVPGTTWGTQMGLLHSLSSAQEVYATLQRVLEIS